MNALFKGIKQTLYHKTVWLPKKNENRCLPGEIMGSPVDFNRISKKEK